MLIVYSIIVYLKQLLKFYDNFIIQCHSLMAQFNEVTDSDMIF